MVKRLKTRNNEKGGGSAKYRSLLHTHTHSRQYQFDARSFQIPSCYYQHCISTPWSFIIYSGTFYRPSVPSTSDSSLSFHSFRSFDLLAGLMLLFL